MARPYASRPVRRLLSSGFLAYRGPPRFPLMSNLGRRATEVRVYADPLPRRERWSILSVRQQAEPPLRKKACSGVATTANPRSSSLRLSRSEQLDRMIEPLSGAALAANLVASSWSDNAVPWSHALFNGAQPGFGECARVIDQVAGGQGTESGIEVIEGRIGHFTCTPL